LARAVVMLENYIFRQTSPKFLPKANGSIIVETKV